MVPVETRYGIRYNCECGRYCWNGHTSTPAFKETHKLRRECHKLFDVWWRSRSIKRGNAYKILSKKMKIKKKDCHIGMFSITECSLLIQMFQKGVFK